MEDDQRAQFRELSGDSSHSEGGPPPGSRRLHRSRDQRMLLGVCGGLAEYFDLDPNLVRVIFAVLTIIGGGGILLYAVLAIVMPDEQMLEAHPREAARATVDEAVSETKSAFGRATNWLRERSPWGSDDGSGSGEAR